MTRLEKQLEIIARAAAMLSEEADIVGWYSEDESVRRRSCRGDRKLMLLAARRALRLAINTAERIERLYAEDPLWPDDD
jgi:hypothetical protein